MEFIDLDAAVLFRKELDEYMDEYNKYLSANYSRSTVVKHISLISFFINDLEVRYCIGGFEQITLGMCGSKLVNSYNGHSNESVQLKTAKNILYKFFLFIYETYGIANHELINKLKK